MENIWNIPGSCVGCGKKFDWHEMIIIKIPEIACMCLPCCDKYPDEKIYDWVNECWMHVEYEPGLSVSKW